MRPTATLATIAGTALALLTGTGVGAAAVHPAATAPSSPWSQTGYNAAQSRANLTEKTLTVSTASKIKQLRSVAVPRINDTGCFSGPPVIAPLLTGGSLYAILNGILTKSDPATGRVLWRRHPVAAFNDDYFSLAVADGLVVVGGEYCGSPDEPGGSIEAFSATTGKLAWSTPQLLTPDGGALQELVVSGRYVVATGESATDGNEIAVFQVATGALVWFRFADQCGGDVVVVAKVVVSAKCNLNASWLSGARLATGASIWRRGGNWVVERGDSDGTTGRHIFASQGGATVVSLDPLTGKTQYALNGAAHVLAVDATRAYTDCGTAHVCAYNSATGKLAWRVKPGPAESALAAEAGGVLYLDRGIALNAATGKTLATLWTGVATSLAIGDGRIAANPNPKKVGLFGLPGS